MDKENRFKLGVPRFFKSSYYSSCRSRILSDAFTTTTVPHSSDISTHSTSFRSFCKPKCTNTGQPPNPIEPQLNSTVCRTTSGSNPLFYYNQAAQASPVSSLILDREFYHNPRSKQNTKGKKKKKQTKSSSKRVSRSSSRRLESVSSDDNHDDEDVFFSSRSRSSTDSSMESAECEMFMNKDSSVVAVVKSSSDPNEDFRMSMVEMIVEKQILSGKDLEMLLQSFLALNSRCHHRVILEVFMEIWDALFSDILC